ncbi:ABC transporter permease [candidate division KSB1 bacterium]|nr:ABC transporter permease [candidate division KSB1 bacterium]
MKRVWAIARKEFLHILRDPRSLAVAILMPLMMVVLYGYAIDMEMKRLRVAVIDLDHTAQSRDFVRQMTAGEFIVVVGELRSRDEIEPAFRRGLYHAVVVLPNGYAASIATDAVTRIQVMIDGADGTTAATVDNYLNALIARANRELAIERLGVGAMPIEPRPRIFFNPELVSAHFVVPGLVAVVLIMICALLTSIAITREKENGTLEQILTTPIRAPQVIIGKVLPYLLIASVDAALVIMIGRTVFGVPMQGSWLVLAAYSIIYLGVALGIGLVISAITNSQQVAMMVALLATMLPSIMLSGFIFPIRSMPLPLQYICHVMPATYYLEIIRGIMLKGDAWFPVQAGVLLVMCVLLLTLAARKFNARIE